MERFKLFIPLAIFFAMAALFFVMLQREGYNPQELPSALIDRPVPTFKLPALKDAGRQLTPNDLKGDVALLNVWATWCVSCRAEHPFLMHLANVEKMTIYGLDYKDETREAIRWLASLGDPYKFTINDEEGRLGLDLGVYGAPETYLLDRKGVIRYKHVGVLDEKVWREKIKPLVDHLHKEP